MKILIAGTGAIGAAVGVPLVEAGEDVFFLARGAHLEAMQKDGLRIKGSDAVRVRAGDRPPEGETAEFVLVAVKAYQNEGAADAFASAVS